MEVGWIIQHGRGLHWGYWCPLTHCAKAPQTPSRAPQPCLWLSLHVRQEQHGLFNHTEKKKNRWQENTITRCIRLVYVCACAKEGEVCVQKWRWFDILVLKYFFLIPALHAESFNNGCGCGGWKCKKNLNFSKKVSNDVVDINQSCQLWVGLFDLKQFYWSLQKNLFENSHYFWNYVWWF